MYFYIIRNRTIVAFYDQLQKWTAANSFDALLCEQRRPEATKKNGFEEVAQFSHRSNFPISENCASYDESVKLHYNIFA